MKKIILFIALTLTLPLTLPLSFAEQRGYTGPSATRPTDNTQTHYDSSASIISVAKAKKMTDNSYVSLQGKIVRHFHKDKYLFQDKSGQIQIEIDDHKWQNLSVNAQDLVEIYGEIDKDWDSIEIDVKSIRKIN
jgi:uncharacterized protein (TIGR00156 family)